MVNFTHTIADAAGTYTRPVGRLVTRGKGLQSDVTIAVGAKAPF